MPVFRRGLGEPDASAVHEQVVISRSNVNTVQCDGFTIYGGGNLQRAVAARKYICKGADLADMLHDENGSGEDRRESFEKSATRFNAPSGSADHDYIPPLHTN